MESERWEQIQTLFNAALDLPLEQRKGKVLELCGEDHSLADSVLQMLDEDARQSRLDAGVGGMVDAVLGNDHLRALVQRQIGPYRLLRVLGEGGMGIVYLAERTDIGGLVAIKLLRDAWLSPMRRERFALEQQTLVKLNHPSIARIYDANTMNDGTPWFVMEYADGKPLSKYLSDRAGSVRDDLMLFRQVCEAVQFAHNHAIIHRDLKPSNILVTAEGGVKLLDFGIAKQMSAEDPDAIRTTAGLRLMTPGYAAPEQHTGGNVGVFTDVYSLGVLLYEILTGQVPKREEQRGGKPLEKPSSLVRRMAKLPDRPPLGRQAWADLDVLCLTALQSEPQRRYRSVDALMRDIKAYLDGRVLEARPNSFSYTASKFIRRNRLVLATTAAAVLLLSGATALFTIRLAHARNAALAEAARTQRIQRFMVNMLGNGDSEAGPANDLKVVTLLDRSALGSVSLAADPQTQIELDQTVGEMYSRLGRYEQSNRLLSKALVHAKQTMGERSEKVAEILVQRSTLLGDRGDYENARKDVQEALNIEGSRRKTLDDPAFVHAQIALGRVETISGAPQKGIDLLTPIARMVPKPNGVSANDVRDSVAYLSVALLGAQRYDLAEAASRRAVEMDRTLLGNSHAQTGTDLINLATAKRTLGELPEAERLYREGLGILSGWYGAEHPDVITAQSFFAATLSALKKNEEAEAILRHVLTVQEKVYGPVHQRVAYTLNSLGELALRRGDLKTAETDLQRAVEICREQLGSSSLLTAFSKSNLALVYLRESKNVPAEKNLEDAVGFLQTLPAGNNLIGTARARWGRSLLALGRYSEAERELTAADALLRTQRTPAPDEMGHVRRDLATLYAARQRTGKANTHRSEAALNTSHLSIR